MSKLIRSDLAKLLCQKIKGHIHHKSNNTHLRSTEKENIEQGNALLNSLSEAEINTLIKLCTQTISDILIAGNSIELRDFGVFELRERKAKTKARNPKTGEVVAVPQHNVVTFRAGKHLKNAVWSLDDI